MDRTGKQFGQTADELGREIRVEQKLQRYERFRPACEA